MTNKRLNLKAILADSDLRRKLMVSTIQATQAREGIDTSPEQADRAYYIVTEAEQTTFMSLKRFAEGPADLRQEAFVAAIHGKANVEAHTVRHDVARRDFATLVGAPLVYAQVGILGPLVRENTALDPAWAAVRGGMNSTESDRFVRYRWEPSPDSARRWVRYSKGGDFARFYADLPLVFDWTNEGTVFRSIVKRKYGSESRFVKSPEFYFRRGLTWTEKSSLGFSVRVLEEGAIFNVAGPAAFPTRPADEWYLLGVLNSEIVSYIAWAFSGRNYGASYISTIPIASSPSSRARVESLAKELHARKANWDRGNETSSRFESPWLLWAHSLDEDVCLSDRIAAVLLRESQEDDALRSLYNELNDLVSQAYGLRGDTHAQILRVLGARPIESVWPRGEELSPEQKRVEHVWRLLSFAVKRVIDTDDDGIVPFSQIGSEVGLAERVRQELAALFPERDESQLEVEIVNELKRSVKGYRKCASLDDWLANAFFEYHTSLYRNRPIFWHIASTQRIVPFAFGVLVHYHRFDKNRMAKLRSSYVRDAIEDLRREAGLADKDGRADDRVELQARLEEVQALDKKLQLVQEGHYDGVEDGDQDFRILTPWKKPSERPNGWNPDVDDGVKVNIAPLDRAGVLRVSGVAG